MNIAFDAKRAYHNMRGLGNYSRDTIRLLSTFYPENTYFLLNPSAQNCVPIEKASNLHEVLPKTLAGRLCPSFWRTFLAGKVAVGCHADIFHGLSQELPVGIHKTKIPVVVSAHDAIFMRYPNLYSRTYRQIFIQKNRYAYRVADRIIAISEQTKADIVYYFNVDDAKIDVVYQGCHNRFRQPITDTQKQQVRIRYNLPDNYILTVGAVERRKNAELIIKALHNGHIDFPFVIAGAYTDHVQELKQLIRLYKMESQVIFLHNVISEDLPALYAAATLFVMPSIFEGFGIPVLEAMCMGTPVIAATGTCFEEVGGSAAHYANPYKEEQWSAEIQMLLADKNLCLSMKQQGLLRSEIFSDENVAKSLMSVYEKLM